MKTKIFLLGGQSNMVGSGDIKALKAPYSEPLPAIRIWHSEKGWIPLVPGHDGRDAFGPDIAFGHEIARLLPEDDVRFIKYAAGGTALYDDWSPVLKGPQYSAFMKTANEAIADLQNANTPFEIVAMLWFQGESDAAEGQAESYEANLVNFIAHMREQFKAPGMPFIIARVLSFYGGKTGQAAIVRDAQVKVAEADPNAAWFDTDDSPIIDPETNQGHYNAEGNLLNGRRFAEAVRAFLVSKGPWVADLRCEDLVDPLGIDTPAPRLSWRMVSDANGAAQAAYQILCATSPDRLAPGQADLWDTGKVDSAASRLIPYGGKPLTRGMPCHWTVRIWPAPLGEPGAWSQPAMWTFADFASDADWQAKWITAESSSPWLRTSCDLTAVPARAFIYVNAIGYFQLFVNGRRVGNDEFTPHVSQLNRRSFFLTYDIKDHLTTGRNAIGLWLGQGWSAESDIPDWPGIPSPAVRAQLEMADDQGRITTLVTDETWRGRPSCLAFRGKWKWYQFGGETQVAADDQPGWAHAEYDAGNWPQARLAQMPDIPVSAEMMQRNRVLETLEPVSVTRLTSEAVPGVHWLVDMGKAMTGTFEVTFPKAGKGHCVTLEFGDDYQPGRDGALPVMSSFRQISEYICRGAGVETFSNRFNYASCRYILITNAPEGDLTPADIRGHLITADLPASSTFTCSDGTLNGIYRMMEHTLRCLMLGGYQVDCHSRERNGYGGDGQASLDTTLCLLRSDAFYRKWTRDWLDGQGSDGGFTYTCPASRHGGGPFWAGFITAATLKNYLHYGDRSLVERNYPAIRKWLELAQSKTVDNLQEKFCGGMYLGDWASPERVKDDANAELFVHAYMGYALEQAAQLAEILDERADAAMFRRWGADRNAATHRKFYNAERKVYGPGWGDQVNFILPLIAGVVPEAMRDEVFASFEELLVVKNKGHLYTGLSGTYLMIQYLQGIGRDDLIYRFASKTTYPSWGYMIACGATATWEHWNGEASRIHNCFNSIASWFIQGLAGIRPDPAAPGFKNAIIKPAFLRQISYVKGSHDSVYGTIQSHWQRRDDTLVMDLVIPANSTATVYVPAREIGDVTVNGNPVDMAAHVRFRQMEMGRAVLDVDAGRYTVVGKE